MNFLQSSKMLFGLSQGISGIAKKYIASQDVAQGVLKAANKGVDNLGDLQKLIENSGEIKDAFVSSRAQSSVNRMLGANTFTSKEEALLKELIDPKFKNFEELFERVRFAFVPTTFPSGQKFILPRVDKNLAVKAAQRYTIPIGKEGDEITGIIAKKAMNGGEECFMSGITRKLDDKGAKEISVIRFFPKSCELSMSTIDADKNKVVQRIIGNDDGGKVIDKLTCRAR